MCVHVYVCTCVFLYTCACVLCMSMSVNVNVISLCLWLWLCISETHILTSHESTLHTDDFLPCTTCSSQQLLKTGHSKHICCAWIPVWRYGDAVCMEQAFSISDALCSGTSLWRSALFFNISRYVCMHVCTHACMHACIHACMHACMHVCCTPYMHAYVFR